MEVFGPPNHNSKSYKTKVITYQGTGGKRENIYWGGGKKGFQTVSGQEKETVERDLNGFIFISGD